MPQRLCLNCEAPLAAPMRFCPNCSQRTDTARLALGDLVRELMHAFVNVERGPLAMLRSLVTRPGGAARDYVAGRRRRHYGPFAMLALLVGMTALIVNFSGYEMLAHDGFAAAPTQLLQRYFNLLLLVQLPLMGAICAIVFRSARLTWPEHMVLAAYTLSLRAIVLALAIPLAMLTNERAAPTQQQVIVFWLAWYLYFGWAASQFYAGNRLINGAKGVLAAVAGHAAIVAVIVLATLAWGWATGAPPATR